MEKKFRRREYYIDRDIQLKYIRLTLLLMLLVCIVMGYTIYQTSWVIFAKKLSLIYPGENIKGVYSFFNGTLILRLLVMVPVVVVVTMYISHRVAGPAFRIERELNEITQGDFTRRVTLRQKDDLKRLAGEINGVVSEVDNLLSRLKTRVFELQNSLKEAISEGAGRDEELRLRLEKWQGSLEKISQELNRFKTTT